MGCVGLPTVSRLERRTVPVSFIVTTSRSRRYDGYMMCSVCGRAFTWSGRGRRPRVCGQRCRKRKSRIQLPAAMTQLRRWALADGKRPVRPGGKPASSTDPKTWCRYPSVAGKPHGIMLGDGLACWDFDDVIDGDGVLRADAADVLAGIVDPVWVERSMSGRGLHVFVAGGGPSSQGKHISYYSWGRFIVVTGDHFR